MATGSITLGLSASVITAPLPTTTSTTSTTITQTFTRLHTVTLAAVETRLPLEPPREPALWSWSSLRILLAIFSVLGLLLGDILYRQYRRQLAFRPTPEQTVDGAVPRGGGK